MRLTLTQQDPFLFSSGEEDASTTRVRYIETGSISLVGTFQEYWNRCSKNLRENLKKQESRLARANSVVKFNALCSRDDIRVGVVDYGLLESKGWKSGAGSAIHPENAQGAFYRDLLAQYADEGEALLFQLTIDDRLAASDLCLVRNGVLYVLKTTYSEELEKFSPALMMRTKIMQWLWNSGAFRSVEFYGRVMEWHRRFSVDVRELYHLDFYASPVLKSVSTALKRLRSSYTSRALRRHPDLQE